MIIKFILFCFMITSSPLFANWTLNFGYHNPVGSTVGANLLYFGPNWAFEIGAGWVDVQSDIDEKDDDKDKTDEEIKNDNAEDHAAIGGDLDVKYLFRSGFFRPYLQCGIGWGASKSAGEVGPSGGVGGVFGGAGVFLGDPKFYVYGSAITPDAQHIGFQAGLGFDI